MDEQMSAGMAIAYLTDHRPVSDAEFERRREEERAKHFGTLQRRRWLYAGVMMFALALAIAAGVGLFDSVPSFAEFGYADGLAKFRLVLCLGAASLMALYALVPLALANLQLLVDQHIARWIVDCGLQPVSTQDEEQMIAAANSHREIAEVMLAWREQGVGLRVADRDAVLQARTVLDRRAERRRVDARWSEMERGQHGDTAPQPGH